MVLPSSCVRLSRLRVLAGAGWAALVLAAAVPTSVAAQSAVASFDIPPLPLSQGLLELGRQADISIAADQSLTAGLRGGAVSGGMPVGAALDRLLAGTGLRAEFTNPTTVRLVRVRQDGAAPSPQPDQDNVPVNLDEIIVTAQKREQSIQDVPIAVTALNAEALTAYRIEGGSELLRAVPNVSFSKANFSMYNFSIRGIGTKAISASSDPAVAVSFNNTPLIRNRLFEQEYLDVNRVEVLRGPQGTLYGRNATAGVVNMFPNLPEPGFEALYKAELGNYGAIRGQAMINIPLSDTFWVRAAGSFTQRDGFDYNSFNDTQVNGRDLWTTRLSAAWEPSERFRASLIWEHFREDDNRSRTGKQLCTRDPGPSQVGAFALTNTYLRGRLSQGCLPGSLYDEAAYGTPNGISMAQMEVASQIGLGTRVPGPGAVTYTAVNFGTDPYLGVVQSRDLREIATSYDPRFIAKNDVYQLNFEIDLTDSLKFVSQTAYSKDDFWSTQDYSRYPSNEIFNDSSVELYDIVSRQRIGNSPITPGGVFNDPQLGPSRRMLTVDLSKSDNRQFFQEFRLQSDFDGRFNFNVGANYLDFKSKDDYYVFSNMFTMIAQYFYNAHIRDGVRYTNNCTEATSAVEECVYVDMSSLDNLAGDGHNYFRSKNEVSTRSWGVFGEAYLDLTDTLSVTAGLRYTDDEKTATPYPSQLLLGSTTAGFGASTGGSLVRGFRPDPDIVQNWQAVTGRFVLDWKPSEDVMAYASYARGYKGGGANPPRADLNPRLVQYQPLPTTFEPEYVDAFELGIKSNLFDERVRLNLTAFYYDYTDYQVSQIVDRISLNENIDATSMGLELEMAYRVTPDFRVDANFGYLKTRIDDGESSIDVMNRTQGNDDWMIVRPWLQIPSSCIAPTRYVETILRANRPDTTTALQVLCGGSSRFGSFDPAFPGRAWWRTYGFTYNPLVDAPNGGRGFGADLSGNELPNSPRWTASVGAQYTWRIRGFDVVARGDYYRQAKSYFRMYNTEYDRLKSWDNVNLSLSMENPDRGLTISAYVKNAFDNAPIVDAFTNSDDTMLSTNVFTLDPRLVGFSIAKTF